MPFPPFPHEFGWPGDCIYCGANQEAVEDGMLSPNCDVLLRQQNVYTAIPVAIGVMLSLILLIGVFL